MTKTLLRPLAVATALVAAIPAHAQLAPDTLAALDRQLAAVTPKLVEWRRDIHAHPELSGQETRTAKKVADRLRALGFDVRTGVGGTGVVATLRGGKPGRVVALRADMDALPVLEATGLPFASKVTARHQGKDTPVMHACGHDGHVAILMGVAQALAAMRAEVPGTVVFVFQPAEEGMPDADGHAHGDASAAPAWGAKAMVAQGALEGVQAIFGLHLTSNVPMGVIGYRSGPLMAGSDGVRIRVNGKGTHGSSPWTGVDPVFAASQVVVGLQGVVSRQLNITKEPAVLSIGSIHGGNRDNIIPDNVEMLGTLRTFDEGMRADAKQRIATTATSIAAASGATADVSFGPTAYPVTSNPAPLTEASLPALRQAANGKVVVMPKVSGSEDFSEFQKVVPGFFYFVGATPAGKEAATAPANHSPQFDFDEAALPLGARTLAVLAMDFLAKP